MWGVCKSPSRFGFIKNTWTNLAHYGKIELARGARVLLVQLDYVT